ncbi:MAG: hypothetical protein ACLFSL_00205 [Candidatus Woesearchaeota archaeon]
MGEILENRCGVCMSHNLHDAYSYMGAQEHRGRDGAGIGAKGKGRIDVIRWAGKVSSVSLEKIVNMFSEINPEGIDGYDFFIGHNRYATRGRKEKVLEDAHPFAKGGRKINNGSHMFQLDCDAVCIHNGQIDSSEISDILDIVEPEVDSEALLEYVYRFGPEKTLDDIPGSYVLLYTDKDNDDIKLLRDKHGMMPAVMGKKDGKFVVTSEDIALRKNGTEIIKNIEPGSYYSFPTGGRQPEKKKDIMSYPQHCFFQWNYIGDSQSNIEDAAVWGIRRKLGEALAEHVRPELDIVSYIPECPKIASMAYADKRGLPFKEIFYKLREERSFQGSDKGNRKESIESNLYVAPVIDNIPSEDFLEGKSVGLIDDSIVRGNNAQYAKDLLEEKGVREVHLISYTPPIGIIGDDKKKRGCMFGIDMPPDDEFVARHRTLDEISEKMGMEVHYLPYEAMMDVYETRGIPRRDICKFCIGGPHPLTSHR